MEVKCILTEVLSISLLSGWLVPVFVGRLSQELEKTDTLTIFQCSHIPSNCVSQGVCWNCRWLHFWAAREECGLYTDSPGMCWRLSAF